MFGKLKRTAEMNNEGIGMGLMICQRLVELNGGQISLTSLGENSGATAFFTYKVKLVELQLSEREHDLTNADEFNISLLSNSNREKKSPIDTRLLQTKEKHKSSESDIGLQN